MPSYASQRVLNACTNEILPFHKVELNNEGTLIRCSAFTHEEPVTTWADGLIVISTSDIKILPGEPFNAFRARIHKINGEHTSPIKSYKITPFNLAQMEFTPQSRILSL